jgi:NSS family neurotransmitter:Na+ symporter
VAKLRREVLDELVDDWRVGIGWQTALSVLVPLQALALLGWWIYRSATSYAPDTWYDPFDPYSVATCLVQWGLGLGLCFVVGRRLLSTPQPEH